MVDIGSRVSGCAMKLQESELHQHAVRNQEPGTINICYALCDPLEHRPRLQNERGQYNPAQVCSRTELRNDV